VHRTAWRNEYYEDIDNQTAQYHDMMEYSGRYGTFQPEYYVPGFTRLQEQLPEDSKESIWEIQRSIERSQKGSAIEYDSYYNLEGLPKELARINNPQSIYTEMVWKQNLWNMLHWLKLRRHPSAQWEIQKYAEVIEKIISDYFPYTYEAWVDMVEGAKLTSEEVDELITHLDGQLISPTLYKKLRMEKRLDSKS
jgi:thymidylate synthase (FAD)